MVEYKVSIDIDDQITLIGGFTPAEGPLKGAALVMHPHPLYGGSMNNNVVEALVQAAAQAGWAALRFNFRGVGGSTGSHDDGKGEQEDVIAAAAWLKGRTKAPLALLGYSFGSLVAAKAADRITDLIGGVWVAPPLILGELPPWPQDAGPLLMIAGTSDEFTNVEWLQGYVSDLGARGELIIVDGGDHFYWGGESALIKQTVQFLTNLHE